MALTSDQIAAMYQAELGRAPDAGGAAWAAGLTADQLSAAIHGSSEYSQAHAAPASTSYTPSSGYDPVAAGQALPAGKAAYTSSYDEMIRLNPQLAAIPREQWDAANKSQYETPMSRGQIENFVTSNYGRPVTAQDFQTYANMTPYQANTGVFNDPGYVSPYTKSEVAFLNNSNAYNPDGNYAAQGGSHLADGVQLIPNAAGWNPATANSPVYQQARSTAQAPIDQRISQLGGYGGGPQANADRAKAQASALAQLAAVAKATGSPAPPTQQPPAQSANSQGAPAAWSREDNDRQSNVKFRRGGRA